MSGFSNPAPAPVTLGEIRNTDTDGAFALDFTANMTARGDTIATFSTLTVARLDGQPLGTGDLTVSGLYIVSGGLKIGWSVQGHGNSARYLLSATIGTANGNTLTRDAYLTSVSALG